MCINLYVYVSDAMLEYRGPDFGMEAVASHVWCCFLSRVW